MLEAQRLRLERTLFPGDVPGQVHMKVFGEGKRLVIESLRVPLLSTIISTNNLPKNKAVDYGNLTKWPQEYRYFVCVIRATATAYRPPMTTATRPVDSINESIYRFTLDNYSRPYNELGYGFVEFINRRSIISSAGRKCPDSEGVPIIIHGLDNTGWKITVELYGLYPTTHGEPGRIGNSSGSSKDHHEKSVLVSIYIYIYI